MMTRDESRTELGAVKIYKSAIASVVDIAANEIAGVKGVGTTFFSRLMLFFGKEHTEIKVTIDPRFEISIDVPLVIKYGYNVPEVCIRVQENIRVALEKTTNLSVKTIDVHVQGIAKEADK